MKSLGGNESTDFLTLDGISDIALSLHAKYAHWHFVVHAQAKCS
jgi:hypothetical protein